jgi:hypothetical protein
MRGRDGTPVGRFELIRLHRVDGSGPRWDVICHGWWLTFGETAHQLGVSPRQVRRPADQGAITRMARGLIDRDTIYQYVAAGRQGRSRAWAEHTAWAAVALLSGQNATWLGATQTSRLRAALRLIATSTNSSPACETAPWSAGTRPTAPRWAGSANT